MYGTMRKVILTESQMKKVIDHIFSDEQKSPKILKINENQLEAVIRKMVSEQK